jgi:hypothetical protein
MRVLIAKKKEKRSLVFKLFQAGDSLEQTQQKQNDRPRLQKAD